jgi:F-type H+-transporting ATPase subunit a
MLSLLATSDFNPVSEFTDFINHPYVDLPLGLDINKGVVYLWLSAATAILVPLLIIRKGLKAKPSRWQTFLELVYDTAYTQIAKAGLPEEGMRIWFPYVGTCFIFIWAMNVIGFIPLPFSGESVQLLGVDVPKLQIYAASANLSVALTLTLVTFVATHVEGIRYNGVRGYFKSWFPPVSGAINLLIVPLEILSQFLRLVSLSVRLFANMLAGHLLVLMCVSLIIIIGNAFVAAASIPVAVFFYCFELVLVANLQAFIFALLSGIYIGTAAEPHH